MRVTLYHFTSSENAKQILRDSFINGDQCLVWLSEHPTQSTGELYRDILLEVSFEIDPNELESYRIPVFYGSENDPGTEEPIPTPEDVPKLGDVYFVGIPADILRELAHNKRIVKK